MKTIRNFTRRATLAASLVAALGALAQAQVDVAIVAAANTPLTDCRFTDVKAKLDASGLFNSVTIVDCITTTPTLAQLQAYDAVITWSNTNYNNGTLLGDTLADYVDAGGGVVVAVFANAVNTLNRYLGGRWQGAYEVILDQSGSTTGAATLGTVLVPAHPVMNGVATFSGGTSSFRPTVTALAPGAYAIANWSDGRVLVAEGTNPQRVDLGFYPPSSACSAGFWTQTTDGGKLLANALLHVATAGTCTGNVSNYCTPATTTNGCVPTMSASGAPSAAAASGFTLACGSVEGQQNGLIFYGISGPVAVPWGSGGTSYLCIKAPLERTPVQSAGGTFGACDGALSVDFLAFLAGNPGVQGTPPSAGQQFWVQSWFRDPPAVKTTNLSDGLTFQLCP